MKKLMSTFKSKSLIAMVAMLFVQVATFADEKETTDVYVSRAPVSELSGHELLEQNWFWILMVVIVIVLLAALLSSKTKSEKTEPHAI